MITLGTISGVKELHDRLWKKYMDRAFKECDNKTLDLLETLPLKWHL